MRMRLRDLREDNDMTQQQVAELLGDLISVLPKIRKRGVSHSG